MNNLELEAQRKALGLSVAELAELTGVSKRSVQYWQQGERCIPQDVQLTLFTAASHYEMALRKTKADCKAATCRPGDTVAPTIKPKLPFYKQLEDFTAATGCACPRYWRTYQTIIAQLHTLGYIAKLDDSQKIPAKFWLWKWLRGDYEHG